MDLIQEHHQRGDYYDSPSKEEVMVLESKKAQLTKLEELYNKSLNRLTHPDDKVFMDKIYQDTLILREALYKGELSKVDEPMKRMNELRDYYFSKLREENRPLEIPEKFFNGVGAVYELAKRYKNSIDLQMQGKDIKQYDFINLDVDKLRHVPLINKKGKEDSVDIERR